jgi:transcriptional regulator with XRE-family HTH domain
MSERTTWSTVAKARSEQAVVAAADEERVTALRELVHRLRTDAGLTQAELARRMGTTQSAIARMENGGTRSTLETLERLAGAVGQDLVVGVETGLRHDQSVVRMVEQGHAVLRTAS